MFFGVPRFVNKWKRQFKLHSPRSLVGAIGTLWPMIQTRRQNVVFELEHAAINTGTKTGI